MNFLAATTSVHNVVVGATDGNTSAGPNTELTLTGGLVDALGTYTSTSTPNSISELLPASTAVPLRTVTFIEIGGPVPGNGIFPLL